VLDIDLPGTDGLTAAVELHRQLPQCRTLVLTCPGGPEAQRRALAAGVSGFMVTHPACPVTPVRCAVSAQ
jgi:two-component system response regulator DesR